MKKIASILINKPILLKLIITFIIAFAIVSVFKINRLGYPVVDLNNLIITAIYPGASPEDVELNLTLKLEEALKKVNGIQQYKSTSMENRSIIQVSISPDVKDPEKVKTETRRVIDSIADLPAEILNKPEIFEYKTENNPIYEVALSSLSNDIKSLHYHTKKLRKIILKLNSVSNIKEEGVPKKEIQILLDLKKMSERIVAFDEVTMAIKKNKLKVSVGFLESYTSKTGIITLSEFKNIKDIENIIIRTNDFGANIRLKDVGRVVEDYEKQGTIVRYNSDLGMSLYITKKGSVDIINAVEEIKNVINKYKKNYLPKDISLFTMFDASIETSNRLSMVYSNAIIGFILVIFVLFVFLDKKIAFWTAAGIPFSIAITLIVITFFDVTINSISLLGFVVVLGMLVDDAIILGESIYSAREEGNSLKDAAIIGLERVYKPVFATIITTIIAFSPIFFLPGQVGAFTIEIPIIVTIMLLASYVESTLMLPAHLAHGKENPIRTKPPGQALINLLSKFYNKILHYILNYKIRSLGLLIIIFIISVGLSTIITKFKMFPIDQAEGMWIYGETSPESSLEHTSRSTKKIEHIIKQIPRGVVKSYKSQNGLKFNPELLTGVTIQDSAFTMVVKLTPAHTRKMSALDVKNFIISKSKNIKLFKSLNSYIYGGGPVYGKPIVIRVIGNSEKDREEVLKKIVNNLEEYDVSEIDTDLKKGKKELRLLPNYSIISEAQLTVDQIASSLRTAFDGIIVTNLHTPEEKIPVRVMLNRKSKNFTNPLKGIKVSNPQGNLIPVSKLVKMEKSVSPENIYHFNGDRTNTITAEIDLEKETSVEIYNKLQGKVQKILKDYPDIDIILGGEAVADFNTMLQMILSFCLAILAIYFVLVLQFNSFTQPVMIMTAIPFGLVGLILAFGVQGIELSMMAMIGIIGFTGVVINDSLVMIDNINMLKKENSGLPIKKQVSQNEIITKGALNRLRPILLTSITTVAGLFPTAYGWIGGIDSYVSPMVMAMMWGLVIGTIFVLIVIPLFYSLNESLIEKINGIKIKQFFKIKH